MADKAVLAPDPKGLAPTRFQHEQLHWTRTTLSGVANASLSTVERVERGQPVRASNLEKIAIALELEPDAFTGPRRELSEEEMVAHMAQCFTIFKDNIPASVAPFRTENRLRALAAPHFAVLDTDFEEDEAHDGLAGLREGIDLAAFHEGSPVGSSTGPGTSKKTCSFPAIGMTMA